MKKISIILSLAAVLALGACSDKDEVRPIPNDPIVTVLPEADDVTINAPAMTEFTSYNGGNEGLATYENGQQLYFAVQIDPNLGTVVEVKKILGTAKDVVIPSTLTIDQSDGTQKSFPIVSLSLYVNSVSESVKTLTLSKRANGRYDSNKQAYLVVDAEYLRFQIGLCPGLEKFEVENGYNGFASINGALYTSDLKQLVCVPRGVTGMFTVADGTEVLQTRCFDHCTLMQVVTIPNSVESIESEAFMFNSSLVLINMLAAVAPDAAEDAFGVWAHSAELRIPLGSEASYYVEKPEIEKPVAPLEPSLEASDEEYLAWEAEMGQYLKDLEAYNAAMNPYLAHLAYQGFTKIVETDFGMTQAQ